MSDLIVEVISPQVKKQIDEIVTELAKTAENVDRLSKQFKKITVPSDLDKKFKEMSKQVGKSNEALLKSVEIKKDINKRYKDVAVSAKGVAKESKGIQTSLKGVSKEAGKAEGSFKKMIGLVAKFTGALSLIALARSAFNFTKEALELGQQAKGVEFAFRNIGDEATNAFNRIKQSTKGLVSDLDIKKTVVEFDNFKLKADELDSILEFVTIRSLQTGQSFDSLRSSASEAITKESVLRADNLGLSQKELNAELDKGATFMEAFGAIAKREIVRAGGIIDGAANKSQKFAVRLENAKLRLGQIVEQSGAISFFQSLGIAILDVVAPAKQLSDELKNEQIEINSLVTQITDVNVANDERERLLTKLKSEYPQFLKFLKDEKTDNDSLASALDDINQQYIKRIALQTQQEKIEKLLSKAGERTFDVAKKQVDVNRELSKINTQLLGGAINLTNKSFQERFKLITDSLSANAKFSTSVKSNVTTALNDEAKALRRLANLRIDEGTAKRRLGKTNEKLQNEEALLNELEQSLGATLKDINALFEVNTGAKNKNAGASEDLEDQEKKLNQRLKDQLDLKKTLAEREIAVQDEILSSTESTEAEKILANEIAVQKRIEIAEAERDFLLANDNLTALGRRLVEEKFANTKAEIIRQSEAKITGIINSETNRREKIKDETLSKEIQDIKDQARERINEIRTQSNDELEALKEALTSKTITIEEFTEKERKIKAKALKKELETKLFFLEKELEAQKAAGKDTTSQIAAIQAIRKQINEADVDDFIQSEEDKKDAAKAIQGELFGFLEELTGVSSNTFQTLFDALDNLGEKLKNGEEDWEDWGEAIDAVLGIATNVFSVITSLSNERLETQLRQLEQQRDLELAFAGDNKAARTQIEEDFTKKQAEIKKKQAKNERKAALFDIGINTARGVVAALTSSPPNVPLSIFIGALGLAKLAFVASQPLPEFLKDGARNFEGGMAVVNDAPGSLFREIIRTPDGNTIMPQGRNVLTYLPKGSDVYTAKESKNMLDLAGGMALYDFGNLLHPHIPTMPDISFSGLTEQQMERVMKKTLAKMPVNVTQLNKNGLQTYTMNGHSRLKQLENEVTFKGVNV